MNDQTQQQQPQQLSYVEIPGEQWRHVRQFPAVEVSNLGRVRNRQTGHILNVTQGPQYEYPRISFLHAGKTKTVEIHRLVTLGFIGPVPVGYHINHRNGDKNDPRVDNLEITTPQQNRAHATQHGLCGGKLKPRDVVAIRKLLAAAVDVATVAKAFAVKPATVLNIARGRSWRAIPNETGRSESKNLPLDFMGETN